MMFRLSFCPTNRRLLSSLATRSVASTTCSSNNNNKDNIEQRKRPEFPGQVRFGFIPEEWFQFFYDKTGVTGPYMFGVGLLTYLCSKEIYVMEHEFYGGLSIAIMSVVAVKKLGPAVANWLDKGVDKVEAEWKVERDDELKTIMEGIENEKLEQWRADGAQMLMEVKRENIELQIEAANREAAMKTYKDIKNRLDYQVALSYVNQRMNQKNMVQWIVRNASDEIAGNAEGVVMEKAIADLSALAVRAK